MEARARLRGASGARNARLIAAVLAGAILLGVAVGFASHLLLTAGRAPAAVRTAEPLFDGEATWAAGARPAPAIDTLRDQNGRLFSLASLHGRPVAIEFFDSHCKQECPLAGRALAAAERLLPRAERPVLVVVSVNPLDTPASTRAAVRAWGLAGVAPWYWLRGTRAQLAPVWSAYHIFVKPEKGDIVHTEALYLLDRRGDERSGYLYPYVPARVGHDLRILAGSAQNRRSSHE
jgi:cytochrome oxidase Cu insertion factor (SCO1/SenC/PrrC family)